MLQYTEEIQLRAKDVAKNFEKQVSVLHIFAKGEVITENWPDKV